MKLGYNTNGFAYHRLGDALTILADIGYDAVALTLDVHHLDPTRASTRDIDAVARLLNRLGLERCVESGARFVLDPRRKHQPTLLSETADERRAREAFLLRCLDVAEDVGADIVSLWSGRASGSQGAEKTAELLRPSLERLLDRAADKGIRLGFEPEPGMAIESLADFQTLDKTLGRHDLGLTLDLGHLEVTEARPFEPKVTAVVDRIVTVHVDDAKDRKHEHLPPGEGCVPIRELLLSLANGGFEGIASVELARHAHDAVRIARETHDILRGMWP